MADVTGRGANGSVASPSRLANSAEDTYANLHIGNDQGPVHPIYGQAPEWFMKRLQPALPSDTMGPPPALYKVEKQYRYANTAGVTMGQNPVQYNPMLSKSPSAGGPAVPLSADVKTYDNASWRHQFHAWAQRFPIGPAAPGKGRLAYTNRYYPQNLPTQITGAPVTGQAVAGRGSIRRSLSPQFVQQGGRGMRPGYFQRQTRLAPPISYSSITPVLGASPFTEGPLGTGTVGGG